MSSEALAWAFKQQCPSSSVKFTLVALCHCSNYKTGLIHPSIAHLNEITGQNRKTIIANIAALERIGLIADTGARIGTTKQIKVYQAALATVPKMEQSPERNGSENALKQSQKRDTEPTRTSKLKKIDAHEIPESWEPVAFGSGTQSASVVDGWPPGQYQQQLEHFTAHHRARGTKFKNWQDAWSTWILNSRKFGNGNNGRNGHNRGGNQRPVDGFAAALRHVADGPAADPFGNDGQRI